MGVGTLVGESEERGEGALVGLWLGLEEWVGKSVGGTDAVGSPVGETLGEPDGGSLKMVGSRMQ